MRRVAQNYQRSPTTDHQVTHQPDRIPCPAHFNLVVPILPSTTQLLPSTIQRSILFLLHTLHLRCHCLQQPTHTPSTYTQLAQTFCLNVMARRRTQRPASQRPSTQRSAPSVPSQHAPPGSCPGRPLDRRDPLPSAEEHSHLLARGGVNSTIANLENAAAATASPLTPVPRNACRERSPPPLNDVAASSRSKKRKRALQPDTHHAPQPQPLEEMLKKTILSLPNKLKSLQKQRKLLIIEAIERGVSLPMIDEFLGKRIALKNSNCWNEYLKTDEARAVFRETRGIDNQDAMSKVSAMWWQLTPEQRRSFATRTNPTGDHNGAPDTDQDDRAALPAEHERNGTSSDSAAIENNGTSIQTALPGDTLERPHLRSSVSFREAADEVQTHMDKWLELATRITQSLDADQAKHYAARFQSFITGYTEHQLASIGKSNSKRRMKNGVTIADRMAQINS
ncbi:hypothetical protein PCASD_24029 [Puccinia coronata f. sp. avenae]|uniref:Uncharacterized protein n=1 Tax=Puccinia coronata f. sp. avenae TaxID=200324 RepID=A0A2N5S510_9BASI|nr:hypothetical protein PCASD_24029 [Puccinia coronata f. sp. avenae]